MNIDFQEILKELEYRVENGIIDLTKEEQVTKLTEILKENGISDANKIAQKARVYFSYIKEIEDKKSKKLREAKQSLETVLDQRFKNPETGNQVKVSTALGYEKTNKAYAIAQQMLKKAGYSEDDIELVDADEDDEEDRVSNVFGTKGGVNVFGKDAK